MILKWLYPNYSQFRLSPRLHLVTSVSNPTCTPKYFIIPVDLWKLGAKDPKPLMNP